MSVSEGDDDRTVQGDKASAGDPAAESGQAGGYIESLAVGTRLGEFEIKDLVGEGGFSIVYLAWDHSLERHVALKEYMPATLAVRSGHTHVRVRSERHRETFDIGLRSFINEGKLLASFDHPSLVKVYRFWEAHGTAYMAMPFYEGVTLKHTVQAMREPPDEAWLRKLLDPLTAALSVIHSAQCYHRDIAPDNVMLLANTGAPLLLDFGAARRVIGDKTQALTVILKPGYAPVEQYAEDPALKQGPWTDVYALSAVVYWAVTGKTPPASVGRVLNDAHVPLAQCAAGRYSAPFIEAMDRGLQVLPQHRTRTIRQLRRELGFDVAHGNTPQDDKAEAAWSDPEATVVQAPASRVLQHLAAQMPAPAAVNAPLHGLSQPPPARATRRWAVPAAMALGLAGLLAGLSWWALQPTPTGSSTEPQAEPQTASNTTTTTAAPSVTAPAAAASATAAPSLAPPAISAEQALLELQTARDPSIGLKASLRGERDGAEARLQFSASKAGFVYVAGLRKNRNELVIVHPAAAAAVPRSSSKRGDLTVVHPAAAGVSSFHVLLAREPRDLAASGWAVHEGRWVRNFDQTPAKADALAGGAWGFPACTPGAAGCDSAHDMTEVTLAPATAQPAAAAAATRADSEPRESRSATAAKTPRERNPAAADKCADILRRVSLGDMSPELIEEMKSLRCR